MPDDLQYPFNGQSQDCPFAFIQVPLIKKSLQWRQAGVISGQITNILIGQ